MTRRRGTLKAGSNRVPHLKISLKTGVALNAGFPKALLSPWTNNFFFCGSSRKDNVKEFSGKFIGQVKRTEHVISFRFSVRDPIDFIPGQFLQVIFDQTNPRNFSLNKNLSFSCAPKKEYIEVTKKISQSKFSKQLTGLKTGDSVLFKGPMGNCVFLDSFKKIAFLIGGIGITPVISIVEHIVQNNLPTDVVLLYSNRTEKDIAFKPQLDHFSNLNKRIKVMYTVDHEQPGDQSISFGSIDQEFVLGNISDYQQRVFFLFGPPGMVEAMKNICVRIKCREENFKTEIFEGY